MSEEAVKTGGMGNTRCIRCGMPVFPYGIHTCEIHAPLIAPEPIVDYKSLPTVPN